MRTLLQIKTLVTIFYSLLVFGMFVLLDLYIFWIVVNYIRIQYLLLILALLSGVFTLVVLNSIIDLIQIIRKSIPQGLMPYKVFSLLIVTIILGIVLIIPGLVSTSLSLLLYITPIRKGLALLLYRIHKEKVQSLFSLFLYEYM